MGGLWLHSDRQVSEALTDMMEVTIKAAGLH